MINDQNQHVMCVSAMCSPPCAHGGTCMRWNKCLCPLGWTGAGCHTGTTAPETPESIRSIHLSRTGLRALFCCCLILIPFLLSYQREKQWFPWYFLNFSAPLTVLFPPQPYVNYPVLTAVAVWGLISASVRQITAAHSAFCVSNKTTNTSGIIYIPSAMWITSGRGG